MVDWGKRAAAAAARRGKKKGAGGWGRGKVEKVTACGLSTAVKRTAGTTGQGASTTGELERWKLCFAGFLPTSATGLRPVPSGKATDTTGGARVSAKRPRVEN